MPYTMENIPEQIKGLPKHAQEIWIAVYNSAHKQYDGDEEKANATAWAAVKTKYKKEGDKWVPKKNFMEGKTMPGSKGFNNWIEIFKGGKQIDSEGREHNGDELIKKAVETFDPAYHEPPVVIGHPKENAPAFGWVEALKEEGGKLYAKFKDAVPEFVDMVKRGLFKKRSAQFYKDGRLRHVGFLGAMPPAVKGLANIEFKEEESITFEFSDPEMGAVARMFSRIRDFIIEKFDLETADKVVPDYEIDYLKEKAIKEEPTAAAYQEGSEKNNPEKKGGKSMSFKEKLKGIIGKAVDELPEDGLPPEEKKFSEDEVKKREDDAAKKEREKVESKFAEKEKEKRIETKKKEAYDFVEAKMKEGKLIPTWKELGLVPFMQNLDTETEITFSEDKKVSAYEWFKSFLEGLPKVINFEEIATKAGDPGDTDNPGIQLTAFAEKKMKENDKLSFKEAFEMVQVEHPDLAKQYLEELRSGNK